MHAHIRAKVEIQFKTHKDVSEELKRLHPRIGRGLSSISIRRFCSEHNIHKTARINNQILDSLVCQNVMKIIIIHVLYISL